MQRGQPIFVGVVAFDSSKFMETTLGKVVHLVQIVNEYGN